MDPDRGSSSSSGTVKFDSQADIDRLVNNPPMDEAAIERFLKPVRSGEYPEWSKITTEQMIYLITTRGPELNPPLPKPTYWDPDDSSTWKKFPGISLWSCNAVHPIATGQKIYGTFAFELYFIEVTKLDPKTDLETITVCCSATAYVPLLVYKQRQEEEIVLGRPLALKGVPPAEAGNLNGVFVSLNGLGSFYYRDHPRDPLPDSDLDRPLLKVVKHKGTLSEANLGCEFITLAAKAQLVFRFQLQEEEEEESPIRIISGIICAFNDEDMATKRTIKSFSRHHPPLLVTSNDNQLKVDRFAFGVPISSNLNVLVDLTYTHKGHQGSIHDSHKFHVQPVCCSKDHFFTAGEDDAAVSLGLTVHWSDI